MRKTPERNDQLISKKMEDGTVIVSPIDGELRVLNEVGAFIWDRIDGRNGVDTIIQQVTDHFDVSYDQADADVMAFIQALEERDLIIWKECS
jgi:hypothetical protein